MDRQRLLSGVKATSPLTGNGRRRRLPIPRRKPTLAKSGVLRTAGYGFNCEIKLSARSGHWLVSYDNDFNLLFLIRSRSSLPALKCGTYFAGTCTLSPDLGLRPVRGGQ